MSMEPLKMRIHIRHVEGAEIAYLYNREAFDLLMIEKHPADNSQFIERGTIIEYRGHKYVVEEVNLKMEPTTYNYNPDEGGNSYSPTVGSEYNCELNVFVEKVVKAVI